MNNSSKTINLFLRRLAAFLYDCLLLVAVFFVITAITLVFNEGQAIEHWSYKLFLFFVACAFFDWFWRHGGQTLGMRAWRIKVVTDDGAPITINHTIKRYVCGFLLFGFTLFFMFIDLRSRALHDKLSKTIIVKNNK
jgi:uncharacterized RDD family membrane protein YckC